MLAREFSRCDPKVVRAIKEVFGALKPLAADAMSEDTLLKKCVGIVAAVEYNVNQLKAKRLPLILSRSN